MHKSIITILLFSLVHVASVHAFDELFHFQVVKGPAKQVTITIRPADKDANLFYGEPSGKKQTIICWFDSVGRLSEEATYIDDRLENGYICQYPTDNLCLQRNYDAARQIDGTFGHILTDSTGRHLAKRSYSKGNFFYADSVVYNALGQKVKQYETPLYKDSLVLKYTYMYDSLGRLSAVYENAHGTRLGYTIEYSPNGNYIEHHVNKDGKKWERKVFVNKDGHVVKAEDVGLRFHFSDYDQYGNWHTMKTIMTSNTLIGWPVGITERTIEYYEPTPTP